MEQFNINAFEQKLQQDLNEQFENHITKVFETNDSPRESLIQKLDYLDITPAAPKTTYKFYDFDIEFNKILFIDKSDTAGIADNYFDTIDTDARSLGITTYINAKDEIDRKKAPAQPEDLIKSDVTDLVAGIVDYIKRKYKITEIYNSIAIMDTIKNNFNTFKDANEKIKFNEEELNTKQREELIKIYDFIQDVIRSQITALKDAALLGGVDRDYKTKFTNFDKKINDYVKLILDKLLEKNNDQLINVLKDNLTKFQNSYTQRNDAATGATGVSNPAVFPVLDFPKINIAVNNIFQKMTEGPVDKDYDSVATNICNLLNEILRDFGPVPVDGDDNNYHIPLYIFNETNQSLFNSNQNFDKQALIKLAKTFVIRRFYYHSEKKMIVPKYNSLQLKHNSYARYLLAVGGVANPEESSMTNLTSKEQNIAAWPAGEPQYTRRENWDEYDKDFMFVLFETPNNKENYKKSMILLQHLLINWKPFSEAYKENIRINVEENIQKINNNLQEFFKKSKKSFIEIFSNLQTIVKRQEDLQDYTTWAASNDIASYDIAQEGNDIKTKLYNEEKAVNPESINILKTQWKNILDNLISDDKLYEVLKTTFNTFDTKRLSENQKKNVRFVFNKTLDAHIILSNQSPLKTNTTTDLIAYYTSVGDEFKNDYDKSFIYDNFSNCFDFEKPDNGTFAATAGPSTSESRKFAYYRAIFGLESLIKFLFHKVLFYKITENERLENNLKENYYNTMLDDKVFPIYLNNILMFLFNIEPIPPANIDARLADNGNSTIENVYDIFYIHNMTGVTKPTQINTSNLNKIKFDFKTALEAKKDKLEEFNSNFYDILIITINNYINIQRELITNSVNLKSFTGAIDIGVNDFLVSQDVNLPVGRITFNSTSTAPAVENAKTPEELNFVSTGGDNDFEFFLKENKILERIFVILFVKPLEARILGLRRGERMVNSKVRSDTTGATRANMLGGSNYIGGVEKTKEQIGGVKLEKKSEFKGDRTNFYRNKTIDFMKKPSDVINFVKYFLKITYLLKVELKNLFKEEKTGSFLISNSNFTDFFNNYTEKLYKILDYRKGNSKLPIIVSNYNIYEISRKILMGSFKKFIKDKLINANIFKEQEEDKNLEKDMLEAKINFALPKLIDFFVESFTNLDDIDDNILTPGNASLRHYYDQQFSSIFQLRLKEKATNSAISQAIDDIFKPQPGDGSDGEANILIGKSVLHPTLNNKISKIYKMIDDYDESSLAGLIYELKKLIPQINITAQGLFFEMDLEGVDLTANKDNLLKKQEELEK